MDYQYASQEPESQTLLSAFADPLFLLSSTLRDCLLRAPLFHNCKKDAHIWLETPSCKDEFLCQDRSMLLRSLARVLDAYERAYAAVEAIPQAMQEQTLEALEHLQAVDKFRLYLRHHRILATSSHSKRRQKTIEKGVQTLKAHVTEVTHDDYLRVIVPRLQTALKKDLCEAMRQAIAAYGPSSGLSATAMNYAIATILIHCGIESGHPETVAERLRGRARSHKQAKG